MRLIERSSRGHREVIESSEAGDRAEADHFEANDVEASDVENQRSLRRPRSRDSHARTGSLGGPSQPALQPDYLDIKASLTRTMTRKEQEASRTNDGTEAKENSKTHYGLRQGRAGRVPEAELTPKILRFGPTAQRSPAGGALHGRSRPRERRRRDGGRRIPARNVGATTVRCNALLGGLRLQ